MSADGALIVPSDALPEEESVLFTKKKRAPAKSKMDLEPLKLFAQEIAYAEHAKVTRYLEDFVNRPTFDLKMVGGAIINGDFSTVADYLYELWKLNRDTGFTKEFSPREVIQGLWEAAKASPAFEEVMEGTPSSDRRYLMWLFNEQADELRIPEGFPISEGTQVIVPGIAADWAALQVALGLKKARTKKVVEDGDAEAALKPKRLPKPKKEKKPTEAKDLRSMFLKRLAELDRDKLYKPWMQTKALRLVTTAEDLQAWVDRVLSDKSLYRECPRTGELMPVVALDTETFGLYATSGLDTRLIKGKPQLATAGLCLSADGVEGLYVPLNHEDGNNLPLPQAREILQPLFDQSLLVFFNSKYDREVLQISCGFTLRPYPYFEDVQILHYLLDPKSEVEEEVSSFESAGLKALSRKFLDIEQIELDTLTKVKVRLTKPNGTSSYKMVLAPFHWVPTDLAVLYAAGDALTTWLLWDKMYVEARKMRFVHKVDHELADALAWIERQRPLIDVTTLSQTVVWHREKMDSLRHQLGVLAGIPDFNPGSTDQLAPVLFEQYGFKVVKRSAKTGKPSTDAEVIEELQKNHKGHPFLEALVSFREYAALHPANLRYDARDHSARLYFKQCTVAGGRLAAMGGKHEVDGGFGLNPQAIKSVGGNLWIPARRLRLEDLDDLGASFDPGTVPPLQDADLSPSCFKDGKLQCPRVVNNHVARYCGQWWSLAHDEDRVITSDGTIIALDPPSKVDANEVINLRSLFVAPEGYTFFVVDYSNIEMRVAANVSREPKFIDEFIHGSGDFHTLTAKNVFPDFGKLQAQVKDLKAQDPKGENPDIQAKITAAKGKMKKLRSLAKIINFALLYGGTEHSIYENMKATDPTITKQKAKGMVDAYWASVPKFDEWARGMQLAAKQTLKCVTPSHRQIDFRSAMKAMRITDPLPEHWDNYRTYWNIKRKAEEAYTAGRKEEGDKLSKSAQDLIMDKTSGVANLGDFKKFMSKIQRVSVNAPLQGLAGDFMRCALGKIHQWALKAGLGDVLLVHATVHDEVDFTIKNEYVPYVLPRLVKLMKLREMHAKLKWPVPIECDCEYGATWDVKEHLTGDDTHSPAGYTKVPGLEHYIPSVFDTDTVKALMLAVRSTDTESRQEAYAYLLGHTHPRVHDNIRKLEGLGPQEATRFLTAILQLHEYWTVEGEPEGDPNDETLESYKLRMGLENDVVVRPWPEIPEQVEPTAGIEVHVVAPTEVVPEVEEDEEAPETPTPEPPQDFQPPEVEESVPQPPQGPMTPMLRDGIPTLLNLTPDQLSRLRKDHLGFGSNSVKVYTAAGVLLRLDRVFSTEIPHEFLVLEEIAPNG